MSAPGAGRPAEDARGGRPVTAADVQELIRRKEELEAQIQANYAVLDGVSGRPGWALDSPGSARGYGRPGVHRDPSLHLGVRHAPPIAYPAS